MEEHTGKLWFGICAGRTVPSARLALAGTRITALDKTNTVMECFMDPSVAKNPDPVWAACHAMDMTLTGPRIPEDVVPSLPQAIWVELTRNPTATITRSPSTWSPATSTTVRTSRTTATAKDSHSASNTSPTTSPARWTRRNPMIEPASTLDMDDDIRGRMITRCVAYMTQRKIPIRDTRAVTRLLASNAGRIDGATNVKVRSYLTDTPAETFQSLETMKQWMGVRKALEYAAIGRIEPDKSSGLAGTPDETGTLIRYFILTFIDRN